VTVNSPRDEESLFAQFEASMILLDEVVRKSCFKGSSINLPSKRRRGYGGGRTAMKRATSFGANSTLKSLNSSRHTAMMMHAVLEEGSKTSIKLNSSTVDSTGALLIAPMETTRTNNSSFMSDYYSSGRRQEATAPFDADAGVSDRAVEYANLNEGDDGGEYDLPLASKEAGSNNSFINLTMSPIQSTCSSRRGNERVLISRFQKELSPMALLDPHQVNGISRPLKAIKSYKIPKCNTEAMKENEFLSFESVDTPNPSMLSNPAALGHILVAHRKLEQELLRSKRRNRNRATNMVEVVNEYDSNDDEMDDALLDQNVEDAGREGPADGVVIDLRPWESEENENEGFTFFDPDNVFGGNNEEDPSSRLRMSLYSEADPDNEYERICRAHLDAFMREAQDFAKDTQLSQRVSAWTRRLEPLLRTEETASAFDIRVYCKNTIGAITAAKKAAPKQDVGFCDVVRGRSSAEVSRVFLSCLQLINAGSLGIEVPNLHSADHNILGLDINLKLLSSKNTCDSALAY
jgi:hypothetical protein